MITAINGSKQIMVTPITTSTNYAAPSIIYGGAMTISTNDAHVKTQQSRHTAGIKQQQQINIHTITMGSSLDIWKQEYAGSHEL